MKKFVFLFTIGLALATSTLFAQLTDNGQVVFNAHLLKTFNLNVDGVTQEITFANANDYNNGVTEAGGIVPGFTNISMETTGNWHLAIEAPDFLPYAGPNGAGTGTIPINNLGVWVASLGTYQFGSQVTCAYTTAANALGLSNDPTGNGPDLIGLGTGNAGGVAENSYRLHWLMGTRQGTMNAQTMLQQMTAGVFGPGDFTSTATLTLIEIP